MTENQKMKFGFSFVTYIMGEVPHFVYLSNAISKQCLSSFSRASTWFAIEQGIALCTNWHMEIIRTQPSQLNDPKVALFSAVRSSRGMTYPRLFWIISAILDVMIGLPQDFHHENETVAVNNWSKLIFDLVELVPQKSVMYSTLLPPQEVACSNQYSLPGEHPLSSLRALTSTRGLEALFGTEHYSLSSSAHTEQKHFEEKSQNAHGVSQSEEAIGSESQKNRVVNVCRLLLWIIDDVKQAAIGGLSWKVLNALAFSKHVLPYLWTWLKVTFSSFPLPPPPKPFRLFCVCIY